ncbi:hypothetical protein [Chryseolinea lacunae]|uniref:Outer membrane protein beta-barrel domain-containing protein n=1 Tax=Chryseolinea lacunae TaxID=2801331 RepID=A0ABS1KYD6_9BACT|nr:hypothetical protein [Chryseolinea lacunae]MBL0744453.1 hypothetical protein [Chryseolinea lacunae]
MRSSSSVAWLFADAWFTVKAQTKTVCAVHSLVQWLAGCLENLRQGQHLKRVVVMGTFVFVLLFLPVCSFSQDNAVRIAPTYTIPLGKLSWSYLPSPGASVSFVYVQSHKKGVPRFITGLTLSYTKLQPRADTLFYVIDSDVDGLSNESVGLGTAVFSPYKMLQFQLFIHRAISLKKKKIFFEPGIAIGGMYGSQSFEFTTFTGGGESYDESVMWATMGPQAAIEFKLSSALSIIPSISYSFMVQVGSNDPESVDYNPNLGTTQHLYSTSLALNYSF